MKVDVVTPKIIQDKYEDLGFPFIFSRAEITEDMLSQKMLENAKLVGKKFPYECMTLVHNAKNQVLATPMIRFYLEIGMKITNVEWAIQYIRGDKPFKKFIDSMVKVRINSFGANKPLGDRAKFTMNSCIGRFGMNLEKHRTTKFVLKENLYRSTRTPLLEKNSCLISEYPINIHEIIKKKKNIVDTIPVQISMFVYQLSKLWLYKFVLILHDNLMPKSFTIAYMGWLKVLILYLKRQIFLCFLSKKRLVNDIDLTDYWDKKI
jgi:hypothetical protein